MNQLTDRERFILHAVMSSTVLELSPEIELEHEDVLKFIRTNRCRNLTTEEVKTLIENIREELLLAKVMWEEYVLSR